MAQQESKKQSVEVQPRATRRTFSAEYKRRILAEADACLWCRLPTHQTTPAQQEARAQVHELLEFLLSV